MSQNKGNILKVTLEYENTILTLEDEDVLRWKIATDDMAVHAYTHGIKFPELNWKTEEKNGTN